jgi:plastocyanin
MLRKTLKPCLFSILFAVAFAALLADPAMCFAQDIPSVPLATSSAIDVRLQVISSLPGVLHAVPAVAWLTPLPGTDAPPFLPQAHYTLMQKNRMFTPHLQVIPVGSFVQFPNADPFYHNVFSLFEGKRFDLGLYEAGSSKSVTFPRVGVSYIFCNIHPEMSAVIITLSTPFYSIADFRDSFALHGVPPGDYRLHLWIEGVPQSFLDGLTRTVHVSSHDLDLGTFRAPIAQSATMQHMNKFGNPYDKKSQSSY